MTNTIGARLKEYRKKAGYTQEKAAAAIGVALTTLARYEIDMRIPTAENVMKLADLYGVTASQIMQGEPERPAQNVQPGISADEALRFALWGGDAAEITQAQLDEVKRFAAYVRERDKK